MVPWTTWLISISVGLGSLGSPAAPRQEAREQSRTAEFKREAQAAASEYEIHLETGRSTKVSLRPEPVLHWTNPVAAKQFLGEVFIWTDRGRPEVVLSLYRFNDPPETERVHHEFHSLALEKLTARRRDQMVWSPSKAGVELTPVPDAPAPADSPSRRLRQLRDLAQQFTAEETTREDVQRQLRLLTQPIYRYESTRPDVLDGALFTFVEGTDPEVFLLIEARRTTEGVTQWQYAVARMNSFSQRVFHKDREVWNAPPIGWGEVLDRRDKTYTILRMEVLGK